MNTSPLKIAFVIDALRVGGAERMLFDLVKSLPKEEFSCRVYTIIEQGELASEFKLAGIPVIQIGKQGKFSLRTLSRLQMAWKEWQPNLVHTHLFAGDTYGRLAAWRSGLPVITTEHNINLDEAGLKRWVRTILSWFTDQIIAVSEAVKEYSVRIEHISPKKITVIYNGVDPVRFSPPTQPTIHHIPVVGVTSRLHPNKGHEFLLRALAQLPNDLYHGLIVGEGPERQGLEKLAQTLGIQDRVQFLGKVDDVPHALAQMDLVALPTLQEGFGLSVVEAMMMGKTVVAFDTGPMKEIIEHARTGWLIPPRDVVALSQAIHLFLSDANLRQRIGLAARKSVAQRFTLDRMVAQYITVYKRYAN